MFYAVLILSLSFHCVSRDKSDQEITREIQAIMRKVASSITSLPCLHETCKRESFTFLFIVNLNANNRLGDWIRCV